MEYDEFARKFHIQLNPQQRAAMLAVDGPVLLLAVPGSGKTTVLVNRIGYMIFCRGIPPENILTLTYTVAAARDMRNRFSSVFGEEMAQRIQFRTINGICAVVIGRYAGMIGKASFSLVTDEKQTLKMISGIYHEQRDAFLTESELKDVRTRITCIKNGMLTDEEIEKLDEKNEIPVAPIYHSYCRQMRAEGLMDYDDQMIYAYRLLQRSPELLRYFQHRFRYILVDEAQDTSKIQHRIIALLAKSEDSDNLFMVGDEDQSIYGFRAAYPDALLSFEKDHVGAEVCLMEQNYRSQTYIVQAADRYIRNNTLRHEKHMKAVRQAQSQLQCIELGSRYAQYRCLLREAERTAAASAQRGMCTAVLYRNHESALPLIDLLERKQLPYSMKNTDMNFFTSRVVTDISNIMRFALDPSDSELFIQIYYKLQMYMTRQNALELCEISREQKITVLDAFGRYEWFSDTTKKNCQIIWKHFLALSGESAQNALDRIIRSMGYADYLRRVQGNDSLLYTLKMLAIQETSIRSFLNRLDELRELIHEKKYDGEDQFFLSTIHASKGLEYDRVFLMDVMDGVLPSLVIPKGEKPSPEELRLYEEERRIFYVGMTRARDQLVFFSYGQKSTFLDEIFGNKQPGKTDKNRAHGYGNGQEKDRVRGYGNGQEKDRAQRYGSRQEKDRLSGYDREQVKRIPYGNSAEKPADADELERYCRLMKPGTVVVHVSFGAGMVLKNDGKYVEVQFPSGTKKMMLEYVFRRKLLAFEG